MNRKLRSDTLNDFEKLSWILILLLGLLFCSTEILCAQNELNVIRGESSNNQWVHFSDVPNALYHHLANEAYKHLDKRNSQVTKLETLADWQKRQKEVRDILNTIVGPFPEKTPLNAQILRTIHKDNYSVEHIVYESQPDFFVTSSLFIPHGLKGKAPVVIYVSGHTLDGYRNETYQQKIINLVNKNFIVFAFDPVGQGERLEYTIDDAKVPSSFRSPAGRHSYSGVQGFITGNTQARLMIWDGIRAVDYLLTRNEVDPDRIGITGRSGGGTQSSYIAAFDDRIHAAAPEAYITNFTRLLQTIGPQDAEQNFSEGIKSGIDHADLLSVRAPNPTLMIATTNDFFSIQGARETANEVSRVYSAYGKEKHFQMVEDFGEHESTKRNREAMYSFFQEYLNNPGDPEDIDVEILPKEEIQVTQTGQVHTSFNGKTISDLNRERAEIQHSRLENSGKNLEAHLSAVLKSAKALSGYREPQDIGNPVLTGRIPKDGYIIEKYVMKGEGDYPIPYLLMIPENHNKKAILYLHSEGKKAEASESGQIEWFVNKGFAVLAPDLIGVGETAPGSSSVLMKEWHASVLIGRSITGIRAGDLSLLAQLLQKKYDSSEILGIAVEKMAPVLLHASAFDKSIGQVALIKPLISYRSMISTKYYDSDFISGAVPGSMKNYDLPDLAASIAPNKLVIINPVTGAGEPVSKKELEQDVRIIYEAYDHHNASENVVIAGAQTKDEMFEKLEVWINK